MWNSRAPRVIALMALSVLPSSDVAFGRMRWAERDGKPVFLHPRRFRLELPLIIDKIAAACPSAVCEVLAGGALTPLLSLQPECSQQDYADSIISELQLQVVTYAHITDLLLDVSRQFDAVTRANMIALAKEYLQTEKNTPLVGRLTVLIKKNR